MFIKSISDPRAANGSSSGKIVVTVADENSSGETSFVLTPGALSRLPFEVRELMPVGRDEYSALEAEHENTAALEYALRTLSASPKSSRELTLKLRRKGFPQEASEFAVKLLEKKHLINEREMCENAALMLVTRKHYGRGRVVSYLLSHGFSSSDARAAADSVADGDVLAALRHNLAKKCPDADSLTNDEYKKLLASLARLGFSYADIVREIKKLRSEE